MIKNKYVQESTVLIFKQLRVMIQQELHFHVRYDRVSHPSADMMQKQGRLLAEATPHRSSEVGKLWQKYCCLHLPRSEEVPSVEL